MLPRFRRRLQILIALPWLLVVALGLTAATATRQLLLDAANKPTTDVDLSGSHFVGTLNSARLPTGIGGSPNAISRDPVTGDLVLPAGTVVALTTGQTIDASQGTIILPADAVPGLSTYGGYWHLDAGVTFLQDVYADGPTFTWNDGGVHFGYDGNYINSFRSSGNVDLSDASLSLPADVPRLNADGYLETGFVQVDSVLSVQGNLYADGSNLTNVPPPAGLFIDPAARFVLGSNGDLAVLSQDYSANYIATVITTASNTLGPLDASALYGTANGLGVSFSTSAAYAINSFDDFFHQYGYSSDISLPGDGTASFANGNATISAEGYVSAPRFCFDNGTYLYVTGNSLIFSSNSADTIITTLP